jgi:hypothetical protein
LGCGVALDETTNPIANLFGSSIETRRTDNNTKTLGLLETLDSHIRLLDQSIQVLYSQTHLLSSLNIMLKLIQNTGDPTLVLPDNNLAILRSRTAASAEPAAGAHAGVMTGVEQVGLHNCAPYFSESLPSAMQGYLE